MAWVVPAALFTISEFITTVWADPRSVGLGYLCVLLIGGIVDLGYTLFERSSGPRGELFRQKSGQHEHMIQRLDSSLLSMVAVADDWDLSESETKRIVEWANAWGGWTAWGDGTARDKMYEADTLTRTMTPRSRDSERARYMVRAYREAHAIVKVQPRVAARTGGQARVLRRQKSLKAIFSKVDRNSDEVISRAELIIRLREDTELRSLLDLPARVTDEERTQFESCFQGMSENMNGVVTFAEFADYANEILLQKHTFKRSEAMQRMQDTVDAKAVHAAWCKPRTVNTPLRGGGLIVAPPYPNTSALILECPI